MPLTPTDVANKQFRIAFRGYSLDEVDAFLDEVETELERLTADNEDLRAKLASSSSDSRASTSTEQFKPLVAPVQSAPEPTQPTPVAAPAPAPAPPTPAPTSVGQASSAAARLLEIATNNADELVEGAKNEADQIIGEARTKAERLTNESRGKADRLESEARVRAQKLDSETAERRQQAFGSIEKDRDDLQREIEHLRAYEREYRSRLKNYFQSQLAALEGDESVPAPLSGPEPSSEHTPRRLKSLFGEDENQQHG